MGKKRVQLAFIKQGFDFECWNMCKKSPNCLFIIVWQCLMFGTPFQGLKVLILYIYNI